MATPDQLGEGGGVMRPEIGRAPLDSRSACDVSHVVRIEGFSPRNRLYRLRGQLPREERTEVAFSQEAVKAGGEQVHYFWRGMRKESWLRPRNSWRGRRDEERFLPESPGVRPR